MKRLLPIGFLIAIIPFMAVAQQPSAPVDPQVAVYRQLLANANDLLAQSVAAMQAQITQLQKELAAEKAKKEEAKPEVK